MKMKKSLFILFFSIIVLIIMGFRHDYTIYNVNLDSNKIIMEQFKNNPIMKKNVTKFGLDNKNAKLTLQLNIKKEPLVQKNSVKIMETDINGVIHIADKSFLFNGDKEIYLISFDSREIYYGNIPINIKNNNGFEEGVLSLRYEPNIDNIDITITSGAVGDNAMIPFGELFLTHEDLKKIDQKLIQSIETQQGDVKSE